MQQVLIWPAHETLFSHMLPEPRSYRASPASVEDEKFLGKADQEHRFHDPLFTFYPGKGGYSPET